MALVVEDGTGRSDAEAYISVANADTYLTSYNPSSAWDAGTEAQQETWLRQGAQWLDLVLGELYDGVRMTDTQALDWPRSGAYYKDFLVASNVVPLAMARANAEAARELAEGNILLPSSQENTEVVESESLKVGPLAINQKFLGGRIEGSAPSYPRIEALVAPIVRGFGEIERG